MPSPVALRRGETALYSYPLIGSVYFVLARLESFARAEPTVSAIIAAITTATPRTKLMRLINTTPSLESGSEESHRVVNATTVARIGAGGSPKCSIFETFCTNFLELRHSE